MNTWRSKRRTKPSLSLSQELRATEENSRDTKAWVGERERETSRQQKENEASEFTATVS